VQTIRAAGGLLWTASADRTVLAVVHRPRYADWSLPKGKRDRGEHPLQTACREIAEETGFLPVVESRLSSQAYAVPEGRKRVDWWTMRPADGTFTPNREVDEMRWVTPDEAVELLSYPNDIELVREFQARPVPTAIVLLVRHAKAGDKKSWPGDDRLRPLDREGRRQAVRLTEVLPLWDPIRVSSADRLRCTQTVDALAAGLGAQVAIEETLSEEAFWADPSAAVERIRDIAALGGASAVCSQGGAIPSIVTELAAADSVAVNGVVAKKGSTWALAFAGRKLISADYYADFRS
jgi:8-oxo-dGTP diphosphatase